MAWRRRDRKSTRPQGSEAVAAFVEFGVPTEAAEWLVDLMQTSVTDAVCDLLPDIDSDTGLRWLWAAGATLPHLAPSMARSVIPDLEPNRETTAALPAMWLFPISEELKWRHDELNPTQPITERPPTTAPPQPSSDLTGSVIGYRRDPDLWFLDTATVGEPLVEANQKVVESAITLMRTLLPDEPPAWGGWGILAAIKAMDGFADVLPRPGRPRARSVDQVAGAKDAGAAFEIGRGLFVAIALALIDTK